ADSRRRRLASSSSRRSSSTLRSRSRIFRSSGSLPAGTIFSLSPSARRLAPAARTSPKSSSIPPVITPPRIGWILVPKFLKQSRNLQKGGNKHLRFQVKDLRHFRILVLFVPAY